MPLLTRQMAFYTFHNAAWKRAHRKHEDWLLAFFTVKVDPFTGRRWICDSTRASDLCAWKHCSPAPYQTDQERRKPLVLVIFHFKTADCICSQRQLPVLLHLILLTSSTPFCLQLDRLEVFKIHVPEFFKVPFSFKQ